MIRVASYRETATRYAVVDPRDGIKPDLEVREELWSEYQAAADVLDRLALRVANEGIKLET